MTAQLAIFAPKLIGEIAAGDDLAAKVGDALVCECPPAVGDIVVVAQKIVSKAEGRKVALAAVEPSPEALALAKRIGKDPRLVELVLRESAAVMRAKPGVLIVRHRLGLVMANAGIDQSNLEGADHALLLPVDPDGSAAQLAATLSERFGVALGVVISDSFGRAWRHGSVNVAIGAAGIPTLWDRRGERDRNGRMLIATEVAVADALAAAAGLVMGEGAEGRPVALMRGFAAPGMPGCAGDLIRPSQTDLFP
ncbi:MAG: coenzyme F420-0:L-glutamate ligase [Erythrobacter sp.]